MFVLPEDCAGYDCSRMTIAFFCVAGLDVLGALDSVNRQEIIDWVYAQQVLPDAAGDTGSSGEPAPCGFRGGSSSGARYNPQCESCGQTPYDYGHLAMTYAALAVLATCGDDFSRVNRKAIIRGIPKQHADGSFSPVVVPSESDMRFLYTACAVSFMLDDFSAIDVDKAVAYVKASQSWDYGIGQGPLQESHAGSTFCAIGTMRLLGRMADIPNLERLSEWLVQRQQVGFNGRPNKRTDTCYSYWVGGAMAMLGIYDLVDIDSNKSYVLSTQQDIGGLAKWPDHHPDPLHSHLGLCGLSLLGQAGLAPIYPALGITMSAAARLPRVQAELQVTASSSGAATPGPLSAPR